MEIDILLNNFRNVLPVDEMDLLRKITKSRLSQTLDKLIGQK